MNKTALITGASGGIGYELTKKFAQQGINVVLVARNHQKLLDLSAEISSYKIEIKVIEADLTDIHQAENIFHQLQTEHIKIDYLVNNAGFGNWGNFHETSWEKEQDMIQLNISALTYFTKMYAREMKLQGSGRILNVASMAAFQPGPLMAVYYATKAYVLFLSEAIRNELKGSGVTVTTLCPGPTSTGFADAASLDNSKLFSNKKLPTAHEVAVFGFNAMMKGKGVVVPGFMNKMMVLGSAFAPRNLQMKIVRMMQESKN